MDPERLKIDLEYATQSRQLPAGESLVNVLGRLDRIVREQKMPERLAHYLNKRSYVKALAWLEDPDTPHHP